MENWNFWKKLISAIHNLRFLKVMKIKNQSKIKSYNKVKKLITKNQI